MTLAEIKDWAWLGNLVVTSLIGVIFWFASRSKATNNQIIKVHEDAHERMDEFEKRLTEAETRLNTMPTHEDLRKQYHEMQKQTAKLDQLIGRMEAREKLLDTIHDHLMSKSQ